MEKTKIINGYPHIRYRYNSYNEEELLNRSQALTHTPSPMNFLSEILGRPENERPFLLIPVGYPEEDVYVPDLKRKELEKVAVYY